MHLSAEQLQTLRSALSNIGRTTNEGIIALQAGQPLPAGVFVPTALDPDPSEDMQVRLKRFLEHIQTKMKHIRDSNPSYGICTKCNKPIAYEDLENEPWTILCASCADE
jgi:RNA polymerase-binding transcription factor DksA